MRNLFAAAIVLAAGSIAAADITHSLVPVDNSAVWGDDGLSSDYYTFDLVVTMSNTDDWTSTFADAVLTGPGSVFYQHALGGDVPNPAFWPTFPALEYDSFWSAPNFGTPGFAGAVVVTDTEMSATWFDTEVNEDISFTAARYTIFIPDPSVGVVGTISGTSTARNTGGDLIPFSFDIAVPAPSTAALLGLGGLVGVRRRR